MMQAVATTNVTLSKQRQLQLNRHRWLPSSLLLVLLLLLLLFSLLFGQLSAFTASVSAFTNNNIGNHKQQKQASFFHYHQTKNICHLQDATAAIGKVMKDKANPLLFTASSPYLNHQCFSLYLSSSNENDSSNEGTESVSPTNGSSKSTKKETKVTNNFTKKKGKKNSLSTESIWFVLYVGDVNIGESVVEVTRDSRDNEILINTFKKSVLQEFSNSTLQNKDVFDLTVYSGIDNELPLDGLVTWNVETHGGDKVLPLIVKVTQPLLAPRSDTSIQDGTYSSKFNICIHKYIC
jgi:hypothetical protein